MTATGVVIALPGEFHTLSRSKVAARGDACVKASPRLWLKLCGIGPERAQCAAHSLVSAGVEALVSWGTAAGLDPALPSGVLLLADAVQRGERPPYQVDVVWRERVRARLENNISLAEGTIAATPAVLDCPQQKADLFHNTHAVAADMESAAIAQVAVQERKPLLIVRAISDPADMVVPKLVLREADPWGRIGLTPLLTTAVRNPGELVGLWRLARAYFAALRTLRHAARYLGADGLSRPFLNT